MLREIIPIALSLAALGLLLGLGPAAEAQPGPAIDPEAVDRTAPLGDGSLLERAGLDDTPAPFAAVDRRTDGSSPSSALPGPGDREQGSVPEAPAATSTPGTSDVDRRGDAWSARYASPDNSWDTPEALSVGPERELVVSAGGSTGEGTHEDALVAARELDTGEERWRLRHDGPAGGFDLATGVAVGPEASLVVAGGYHATAQGFDTLAVGIDAETGERAWTATPGVPGFDEGALDLALGPDGERVFLTGIVDVNGVTGDWDWRIVALDAETGLRLWTQRIPGPAGAADQPHDVEVGPEGSSVYVGGYVWKDPQAPIVGAFRQDGLVVSLDARTGALEWASHHDDPPGSQDVVRALDLAPDGSSVYAAGVSTGNGSLRDGWVTALDASTGRAEWNARYDGPRGDRDWLDGIAVGPEGERLYAAGHAPVAVRDHFPESDALVLALDADDGHVAWERLIDGPSGHHDGAYDVAVAPDGSTVAATGWAWNGDERADVLTASLDADQGQLRWQTLGTGAGGYVDFGQDVAFAPGGNRVLTGATTWGGASLWDEHVASHDAQTGERAWAATSDGPGNLGYDAGKATALGPEGEQLYTIAGSTHDSQVYRLLVRDAETGSLAATQHHSGPFGQVGGTFLYGDFPLDLDVAPSGDRVVASGIGDDNTWNGHVRAIYLRWISTAVAFDTDTGEVAWSTDEGGGRAIEIGPEGERVFTGVGSPVGALSLADGERLWAADDGGWLYDLAAGPEGERVFVTGKLGNIFDGQQLLVAAYDAATGQTLWYRSLEGPAESIDAGRALAVGPDGEQVFVTGEMSTDVSAIPPRDYATVSLDAATGEERWRTLEGGNDSYEQAFDVALSPDGDRVYVTGRNISQLATETAHLVRGNDYMTVAYDADTGERVWRSFLDRGLPGQAAVFPEEIPTSMALSPDGDALLVTGAAGHGEGHPPWDYATVAYDTEDGTERWRAIEDGPSAATGSDVPFDVAVDPDGEHAYVTGRSWAPGTNADVLTVAYPLGEG